MSVLKDSVGAVVGSEPFTVSDSGRRAAEDLYGELREIAGHVGSDCIDDYYYLLEQHADDAREVVCGW